MSDMNTLSELAHFIAKSPLAAEDVTARQSAVNAMRNNLLPQAPKRKVVDLLGTVMALSARTRRVVQPKVEVELDVFAPNSRRAVIMTMR